MTMEPSKAFSQTPPASPWGVNFGGGVNSTAMLIEMRRRGLVPDWILFADTGSERPETYQHVQRMQEWCRGWRELTIVRWIRKDGRFEALHDNCLRTGYLPSKAYGLSGCTYKWKVYPMERWRKRHGFDHGAFAVGYDADEHQRIQRACARGDDPRMIAWYPLVAWGIGRKQCINICNEAGLQAVKSACFCCPHMKHHEWLELRHRHRDLFDLAVEIQDRAAAAGNLPHSTRRWPDLHRLTNEEPHQSDDDPTDDRCIHGSCFT